jgi:long-chain acyl-CoA synthetase
MPEETAAAIDPEGWFHTGDIGEMEGVSLKITDRKKDIIVLGNGKNIAPQALENRLRASEYIAEAVVLGDGKEHLSALIVPQGDAVRKALQLGPDAPLTTDPNVKALIKKEIDAINKTVAPFEAVKRHALLDHPFTIESGELTPTLKVKRKVVRERYADIIATLY